jgi:hypothetical protein
MLSPKSPSNTEGEAKQSGPYYAEESMTWHLSWHLLALVALAVWGQVEADCFNAGTCGRFNPVMPIQSLSVSFIQKAKGLCEGIVTKGQ